MLRVSRSAIQSRRQCQHKRFWQYDYAGKGLERRTASLPLVGGQRQHAAHARILMGENVETVIAEEVALYGAELHDRGVNGVLPENLAWLMKEQQTLLEGLIRGWVRFRLPLILDEYEPVACEQEWTVKFADDFELPLRIDSLERHRGTGLLHIRDFKTSAYLRDGWREHYLHDLQTLLYVEAVERHTGEYVDGIEYEALLKGGRRKGTGAWADREVQQSALCYGYKITTPDSTCYQSGYTTRKGSSKFAVWEEFSDVADWFDGHLESEVWRELYTTTGLIAPTKAERRMAVQQVVMAERNYAMLVQDIERSMSAPDHDHDDLFWMLAGRMEPNTDHCYQYGSRHRCAFAEICHREVSEAPLECGLYDLRVDHHEQPEETAAEEAA